MNLYRAIAALLLCWVFVVGIYLFGWMVILILKVIFSIVITLVVVSGIAMSATTLLVIILAPFYLIYEILVKKNQKE